MSSSSSSSPAPTKDPYKYDDTREERLGPVPQSSTRQRAALHPVRSFPTGHDTITRAFFGGDVSRHKDHVGRATRWLDPLRIDATFGMGNDDSEEGRIRRTFRRLESSALFSPPAKDSTSLEELLVETNSPGNSSLVALTPSPLRHPMVPHGLGHGSREGFEFSDSSLSSSSPGSPLPSLSSSYGSSSPSHSHPHHSRHYRPISTTSSPSSSPLKFVLIQEHQLEEFAKFENILREERALLGEQCVMVLADVQVSFFQPFLPLSPYHTLSPSSKPFLNTAILFVRHMPTYHYPPLDLPYTICVSKKCDVSLSKSPNSINNGPRFASKTIITNHICSLTKMPRFFSMVR